LSRYLNEARLHSEKIKYYHENDGVYGYSQARYHYNKLSDLVRRSFMSKHNKNDSIIIQRMVVSAEPLMEEMKQRQDIYLEEKSRDFK